MRHRKRQTWYSQWSWSHSTQKGFQPISWFSRRNPRTAGRNQLVQIGSVGHIEVFSVTTSRIGRS